MSIVQFYWFGADSDGTGTYKKGGVQWFDVTANKRFVPGGVNQEFVEGHVYKVTIDFRTKADYEFADEGILTATINGQAAVVEYVTYGQFAGISYTFPMLVHKHDMERTDKKSPTCTGAGKQTYYHCRSCGKYYEDAAATKQITNLSAWGNLPALGHTESDLKANSTHHFTVCIRCYQEISGSKAGHSGGIATCQEKAKCETCGTAYGSYAEHNLATDIWGFIDPTGHAHMCLTENCYFRGEVAQHRSSGAATADKDEVCLDCGYVIALSENHAHTPKSDAYLSSEAFHWQVCACGEPLPEAPHADVDGDGLCDVCAHDLSASPEPTVPGGTTPGGTTPGGTEESEGGSSAWIWILLILAVLLAGGGSVWFFLLRKQPKKKPTAPTAQSPAKPAEEPPTDSSTDN